MSGKKIGKNFKKIIPLYKYFGQDYSGLDWSEDALLELYFYESTGKGNLKPDNGYAHGKKMMNITISMWKEDLDKYISLEELYEDSNFPHWWLDKIFSR
jgi:hypothetical protein